MTDAMFVQVTSAQFEKARRIFALEELMPDWRLREMLVSLLTEAVAENGGYFDANRARAGEVTELRVIGQ